MTPAVGGDGAAAPGSTARSRSIQEALVIAFNAATGAGV
jgi:hypothetical protein